MRNNKSRFERLTNSSPRLCRGYLTLKNAIASGNKEHIKFVEDISEIITINVLEKIIKEI
jgi:hypothetical protein